MSGLSNVAALVSGDSHVCALLATGTVKCWGYNDLGQLGNGTSTGPQICGSGLVCSRTPVSVVGLTGVTALAAGTGDQSCALLAAGTVKCCGRNASGELGTGTSFGPQTCFYHGVTPALLACSTTPVTVTGLSGVTAIDGGEKHSCALLVAGNVKCWGLNNVGELGNGTTTDSTTAGSSATAPPPSRRRR